MKVAERKPTKIKGEGAAYFSPDNGCVTISSTSNGRQWVNVDVRIELMSELIESLQTLIDSLDND